MSIQRHTNTELCSKDNGILGDYIHINVVVFQGSPLSAQLFIIYSDNVMNEYNNSLKTTNIPHQSCLIRDENAEIKRTNNQINDNAIINNNNKDKYAINKEKPKNRLHTLR